MSAVCLCASVSVFFLCSVLLRVFVVCVFVATSEKKPVLTTTTDPRAQCLCVLYIRVSRARAP